MYFRSRAEAGEVIADKIIKYRYENCAVVALGYGAVLVAEPIAARLHGLLGLFVTESIHIPGENLAIGTVDQGGGFLYNKSLSQGEVDDYYGEFHGYIEDQKREQFAKINRLLAGGGMLDPSVLREHVIILVSDGLKTGQPLDAAAEFLKPIKIKRLIVVTPLASVQAVDRMHIVADEIHCLSVTDNYLDTNHYYDVNDIPTHQQAQEKVKNIVLAWR